MNHLDLETLARLVDDTPSPEEREHLEACIACRTELDLLRGQTLALGQLPDLRPPQGDWAVLEASLMSEGLLKHERSFLASTPAWMKAAAAVVLFLGGTGLGMALADTSAAVPMAQNRSGSGPYTLVDNPPAQSLEEAEAAVRFAERQFMDALVQYRQISDAAAGPGSDSPVDRLAALEHLVVAGQAAVQQVPTDPILNGFLASAMAERQATYRQVLQQTSTSADWY